MFLRCLAGWGGEAVTASRDCQGNVHDQCTEQVCIHIHYIYAIYTNRHGQRQCITVNAHRSASRLLEIGGHYTDAVYRCLAGAGQGGQ